MKKLFLSLALAAAFVGFNASADDNTGSLRETYVESVSQDYVDFFFNGFVFKIPQNVSVNMEGQEATIKSNDGTFGVSIKTEKDSKATAQGAYEICQRSASELHLKQPKLTKISINGLEGASVEGELEGMNVAVEVLDAGKRYLKVIVLYTDAHVQDAKTVLTSAVKE